MVENKEVFAKNLKKYMAKRGVNAAEVCKALGFRPNTYSNWMNAKIFPRINKIQDLADFFGVNKSALIEDADNITLSPKESKIIIGYRESDDRTRTIVDKILIENDSEK